MTATHTEGEWISWREARDRFRIAKYAEQEMYPRAVAHYDRHGTWPEEYVEAMAATSRAFGFYVSAGYFSGITLPAADAKLKLGAVVDYHGPVAESHGRYVFAGSLDDLLTLLREDRPADRAAALHRVRRSQVTPTGEQRPLCAGCRLPADLPSASCLTGHQS